MAIGKVIKGDGLAESVVVATSERPALRPPRAGVMNAEVFEARRPPFAGLSSKEKQP